MEKSEADKNRAKYLEMCLLVIDQQIEKAVQSGVCTDEGYLACHIVSWHCCDEVVKHYQDKGYVAVAKASTVFVNFDKKE